MPTLDAWLQPIADDFHARLVATAAAGVPSAAGLQAGAEQPSTASGCRRPRWSRPSVGPPHAVRQPCCVSTVSMYRYVDTLPVDLSATDATGTDAASPAARAISHLRFDRSGVLLACATAAGSVHVYDYDEVAARVVTMRNARAERSNIDITKLPALALVESLRLPAAVADCQWHPRRDNDMCIIANGAHSIAYYDLERPAAPLRTLARSGDAWPDDRSFSSAFTCARFSCDAAQDIVLAGDGMGRVRLFDLRMKAGVRWGVSIADSAVGPPAAFTVPTTAAAATAPVAAAGTKRPRDEILSARNLNVSVGHAVHSMSLAAAAGKSIDDSMHALLSRSIRCVWNASSAGSQLVYAVSTGGHMTAWDLRKMSVGTMGTKPKPAALWSMHIASAIFSGGRAGEVCTSRVQSALPATYAEGVDALCLTIEDGRTAQVRLDDGHVTGMLIPSIPAGPSGVALDASITYAAPVNGTAHAHGRVFVPFRVTSTVTSRLPADVRTYWMGRRAGELVPPPAQSSSRDQISMADWMTGVCSADGRRRWGADVVLLSHEQPGLPAHASITAVAPHPIFEDQIVHATATGQMQVHGIWSSE